MVVRTTSKFRSAFRRLPRNVRERAVEKEEIFKADPFDPRLDTHKLHGKYKSFWAFTVVGQCRITFAFVGQRTVDFINVGTHDIYK